METVSVLLLIANIVLGVGIVQMRSALSEDRVTFIEEHKRARELNERYLSDIRLQLETERRVIESFHETAHEKLRVDRDDINNTRKSFLIEVAKVAQARRVRA